MGKNKFRKREVWCPYCGQQAVYVGGDAVYPHRPDLRGKRFYVCRDCDARVGCHPNSSAPLGRLANGELRRMKMAAHAAFDPLWRGGGKTRHEAYRWLADALGIPFERCHIGEFDEAQCRATVTACRQEQPR